MLGRGFYAASDARTVSHSWE